MDFDQLVSSIGHQFAVILQAPVPFIVAVLIATFAIWKVLSWRYDTIIEHLREQVAHLEKKLTGSGSKPSKRATAAAKQEPVLPALVNSGPRKPEPRVFLPDHVTFQSLIELRGGLTGIQGDKITAPYKGKWMRVSGTVFGSGTSGEEAYINIHPVIPIARSPHIGLYFDADTDGIEAFANGDTITAIGKIAAIIGPGMVLRECELVPA
jgi:hypothetical protein